MMEMFAGNDMTDDEMEHDQCSKRGLSFLALFHTFSIKIKLFCDSVSNVNLTRIVVEDELIISCCFNLGDILSYQCFSSKCDERLIRVDKNVHFFLLSTSTH